MIRNAIRIAIVAIVMLAGTASAQCPKCGRFHPPYGQAADGTDALDEVNAERTQRGMRPFLRDELLTQAALACARIRAARHIHGHLPNDFAHLPPGAHARSAGCGALEPSWGWGTCCTYENYTYAGAAWVMGSDGRRYMHLFVR